jgi:hypothetical protein
LSPVNPSFLAWRFAVRESGRDGPRHKINVARSEDEIQLILDKEPVSIDAFCVPDHILPGETYLTTCSDLVNTGFVNRYRGRKTERLEKKDRLKHHEKDHFSITWTLPDAGHGRVVARCASPCGAGNGHFHPRGEEAREKE